MYNLQIKVDVTMNGAVVIPTTAQFQKIQQAVQTILSSGASEQAGTSFKAKRQRRRSSFKRWTDEEDAFVFRRLHEGLKPAEIAVQLNRTFDSGRNKSAVEQRIIRIRRSALVTPTPETNPATHESDNEFKI